MPAAVPPHAPASPLSAQALAHVALPAAPFRCRYCTVVPPTHPTAPLQGAGVVDTIRSGITNISYFYDSPDVLAYGKRQ